MADTANTLIASYRRDEISFDQLVKRFSAMPMSLPRSMRDGRTWADVYREAEEGDDGDIPEAVTGAHLIGHLTQSEADQLMAVYRRKFPA